MARERYWTTSDRVFLGKLEFNSFLRSALSNPRPFLYPLSFSLALSLFLREYLD